MIEPEGGNVGGSGELFGGLGGVEVWDGGGNGDGEGGSSAWLQADRRTKVRRQRKKFFVIAQYNNQVKGGKTW